MPFCLGCDEHAVLPWMRWACRSALDAMSMPFCLGCDEHAVLPWMRWAYRSALDAMHRQCSRCGAMAAESLAIILKW